MRNLFGGDPHFNNVVFCLSNAKDVSKYGHIVSVDGVATVTQDTTLSQKRSVLDVRTNDGGYVTVPDAGNFNLADLDFTIEFLVWFESVPGAGAYAAFVSQRTASNSNNQFTCWYGGTEKWYFNYSTSGSTQSALTGFTTATPVVGKWYHVVFERVGGNVDLYVNGERGVTQSIGTASLYNSTADLLLGSSLPSYLNDFDGYIAFARITKGIARYRGAFGGAYLPRREAIVKPPLPAHGVARISHPTPITLSEAKRPPLLARRSALSSGDPHFNNVVAQVPLRESFKEQSKFARVVITYGDVNIVGNCANFDGTGDYFTIANSTAFSFITEDFTIEGWVRFNSVGTTSTIVCKGADAGTYYPHWRVFLDGTTSKLYYELGRAQVSASRSLTLGNTALAAGRWYHFAFTRSGSTLRGFLDGKLDAIATLSITPLDSSYGVYVGNSNLNNELNGSVRDLRITKGVARYVSDFTPPTSLPAPHGVPTLTTRIPTYMQSESVRAPVMAKPSIGGGDPHFNNVGVLAPLQRNIYDKSKSPKTVSYSSGQIVAYPEYTTFSGATSWIGYASSSAWDLADKDFTIEIEFYQTARPNTAGIVNHENTNVASGWSLLTHSVAGDQLKFAANSDNSTNIVTLLGGVPALNTWHRIAVVRRGNWWGLYRNEQLVTSAEASGTIQNANTTLYLGIIQFSGVVNSSYDFTGRMRNLRITKGIARDIGREQFGLVSYSQHGVPSRPVTAFAAPASPISSALSAIYQDALLQWAMAGSVYREAPYQWNTLNSLLRTAQADWHLTNAAQRDASAAWDTIAAAYREAVLNWDSAGQVLRSGNLDWSLLNTAERTAQTDWHLVNAALREAGVDWNTVSSALRDIVAQWDILFSSSVDRSVTLGWDDLNAAQRDAVAQWIVAISVNRPADLQWIVAVAAARSAEARWELLRAVERDNLISWNTIQRVFREAGLDWLMLEPFIHEGRIDWNLANSAEAQAELAWGLVQAAERDAEVRFNLATAAFQDAETAWNVLSAAVRDMTAQWDLIGAVLRSMDAQWDDIVGIEKSSELAWNVAISAAQSLEHAWNTLGNAAKDATIQWTKIGTAEGAALLEWKIIPLYGTESPPQYILIIEEENRVTPVDFESRSRVVPAELRTLMVPPAEDDTYGKML